MVALFLFLKGVMGALAPFSYLVQQICALFKLDLHRHASPPQC